MKEGSMVKSIRNCLAIFASVVTVAAFASGGGVPGHEPGKDRLLGYRIASISNGVTLEVVRPDKTLVATVKTSVTDTRERTMVIRPPQGDDFTLVWSPATAVLKMIESHGTVYTLTA